MASTVKFSSVARVGVATVSVANANRDGTGTIVDVLAAVAAGTKVFEVVVKATGDPADSVVTLFLWDGTTSHIFDEIDLGDPAAGSTTAASGRIARTYENLILPSVGATLWKLQAAITVAPTAGTVKVLAFAGDLT